MNWALLQNSLILAAGAACLGALLGVAAALCHLCLPGPGRSLLSVLAILNLAWPPFLVANTWLELLSPGSWLRDWPGLNPLSMGAAIPALGIMLWPIAFFFTAAAWSRVRPALLESDSAVKGWNLFRAVLWPQCASNTGAAALLIFVLALNNFAVPAILQVKVLPAEVWIAFSTLFQPGTALLMGLPLIVAPALAMLFLGATGKMIAWPDRGGDLASTLARRQVGRPWLAAAACLAGPACGIGAALPGAVLVFNSKTWAQLPGALAAGGSALWNSAWQPVCAATLLVVLALVLNARHISAPGAPRRFWGGLAEGCLWLPFFAPGVMLGIVLISLLNRPGFDWLYQSALVILLALAIRYAAVAWSPVQAMLRGADPDVVASARLGGASPLQILVHVLLPTLMPRLAAVWYVIFLLVLWDVETVLLLYPPGHETLAFNVFNFLHYGYAGEVNALCVILAMLALMPFALWQGLRLLKPARRPAAWLMAGLALAVLAGCHPSPDDNRAELFSANFQSAQIFGTRGAGVGQFNKPRSVAVDAAGSVYAVDMTGRVQKFSANGVFELSWQMPQTDLGKPKGMTRGSDGEIVVIEPHYRRLTHFDLTGGILAQWGRRGTNAGEFMLPRGVAINDLGEVYVSEYTVNERVQWFSKRGGQLLGSFGRAGTAPGEFNRPEGICVDMERRVYVADSCNHRVEIFSREGKFLRLYGHPGKGLGELSYPYDICVDAAGAQYVCEFGNSRIQVFDKDCHPVEIIGGPGSKPGQFSNPWGIALDPAGNLWVADSQNHRLQKLTRRAGGA